MVHRTSFTSLVSHNTQNYKCWTQHTQGRGKEGGVGQKNGLRFVLISTVENQKIRNTWIDSQSFIILLRVVEKHFLVCAANSQCQMVHSSPRDWWFRGDETAAKIWRNLHWWAPPPYKRMSCSTGKKLDALYHLILFLLPNKWWLGSSLISR